MKAYYIHWVYPATADDALYYGGNDDSRLFHKRENAERVAERELNNSFNTQVEAFNAWCEDCGHPEHCICIDGDSPCDYKILERDIKFED